MFGVLLVFVFMNANAIGGAHAAAKITDSNFASAISTCLSTNAVDGLCSLSEYGSMPDWDVSEVTNMYEAFHMKWTFDADISNWNVGKVTDMTRMFTGAAAFKQQIGSWNTSSVTSMKGMFNSARLFLGSFGSAWDTSKVTDMSAMFAGCFYLGSISSFNTSQVTDMSHMFADVSSYEYVSQSFSVTNFDTSKVRNMAGMFSAASYFLGGLNGWNTSQVTDMSSMFYQNRMGFSSDLNSWDTSQVRSMSRMFYQTYNFNGDITSWNTSQVRDMSYMFSSAREFDQDISTWNVSSVESMSSMFSDAVAFDQDISGWNTSSVFLSMDNMFLGATAFQTKYTCLSDVSGPPSSCSKCVANCNICSTSDTSKCAVCLDGYILNEGDCPAFLCDDLNCQTCNSSEPNTCTTCKSGYALKSDATCSSSCDASISPLNGNVGNCTSSLAHNTTCIPVCNNDYKITGVTSCNAGILNAATCKPILTDSNFASAISTCLSTNAVDGLCSLSEYGSMPDWDVSEVTNMYEAFHMKWTFDADISNWNVGKVTDMTRMFTGAAAFKQQIGSWNTSSVTSMKGMFNSARLFLGSFGSAWDTSKVTDMSAMFAGCFYLGSISSFNTSQVTDMSHMFADVSSYEYVSQSFSVTNFDTSKVRNMAGMFSAASYFLGGLNGWNTSQVTDMSSMFYQNRMGFSSDLNSWDTSQVRSMSRMFYQTYNFNGDITSWNTSQVRDMSYMFSSAREFDQDISTWNVSSVESMSSMFSDAVAFDQDISGWDTSKVKSMSSMFHSASVFNEDISNWNTSKVVDMSYMFHSASAFDQDISDWNTSKVTDMSYMFSYTSSFDQPIGRWDVPKVSDMTGMFSYTNKFAQDVSSWGSEMNTDNIFTGATAFPSFFTCTQNSGVVDLASCSWRIGLGPSPPPLPPPLPPPSPAPNPPSPPPPIPIIGRVIDGYLVNCYAWIDIDGDESRDESFEPFVLTSTYGSFTLQPTNDSVSNSANLVVDMSNSACVDAFTSNPPGLQILSAPPKASIVTPLSTLVTKLLKLNASYDANTLVISAFGLDTFADIMNTDPFEEMVTNAQVYKNVVVSNTLIANAISSMMRLIQGAGGSSLKNSQSSAFKALAMMVVSANNRPSRRRSLLTFSPLLNLTNVAVISELAENTVSQAKTDGALSSSASVSTSSIEAVSNATANSGSIEMHRIRLSIDSSICPCSRCTMLRL